jgi:hypothetical protein
MCCSECSLAARQAAISKALEAEELKKNNKKQQGKQLPRSGEQAKAKREKRNWNSERRPVEVLDVANRAAPKGLKSLLRVTGIHCWDGVPAARAWWRVGRRH